MRLGKGPIGRGYTVVTKKLFPVSDGAVIDVAIKHVAIHLAEARFKTSNGVRGLLG
jgi:hypothetical protein